MTIKNHHGHLFAYNPCATYEASTRQKAWNDPSYTIDTHTRCAQTHPGEKTWETTQGDKEEMTNQPKPLLDALPQLPQSGFTSVELFAGGGLMRLGVEWAGIKTIWANDFDKGAVIAHLHNFGEGSIVQGDITAMDLGLIPDADFVIGGPPCQDFSIAGKGAGEEGDRGKLVWKYLEIIEKKEPKAFLFENVKGLIQKKHRPTFDRLIEEFRKLGYLVSWKLLNAWDYGVAQKRERVFIVGIREDMDFTYEFPQSEFELTGYHPVLRDAIGDLPEPVANHDPKPLTPKVQERLDNGGYELYHKKHPMAEMDKASATLTAHLAKGAPDGLIKDPPNHDPEPLSEHQQRRFDNGEYENYLKKHPINTADRPSASVTTRFANPLDALVDIPPSPRRFTVRECLRIQSVPDTYSFPETMALSPMYRVVGNGVASRVAYHLSKALVEQMKAAQQVPMELAKASGH